MITRPAVASQRWSSSVRQACCRVCREASISLQVELAQLLAAALCGHSFSLYEWDRSACFSTATTTRGRRPRNSFRTSRSISYIIPYTWTAGHVARRRAHRAARDPGFSDVRPEAILCCPEAMLCCAALLSSTARLPHYSSGIARDHHGSCTLSCSKWSLRATAIVCRARASQNRRAVSSRFTVPIRSLDRGG